MGFSKTTPPPPGYIFALDPDGSGTVIAEAGQTFPNGITVEADGNVVWVESFTRAVRRYHVDTGKVETVTVLEDPDAIPDGLKPATNGDLYIATVTTGGINVVGADGSDKGLLKGFGDYVSNVQFRGSDALRHRCRRRAGRRRGVPRIDFPYHARWSRRAPLVPRHHRLGGTRPQTGSTAVATPDDDVRRQQITQGRAL